jgi:hypothetical protein
MTMFKNLWVKLVVVALVAGIAGAVIVERIMSQVVEDLGNTDAQLKVLSAGTSAVTELGFLDKGDIESLRKLKENDLTNTLDAFDQTPANPRQALLAPYAQPYLESMKRYRAEHPYPPKPAEAAPPQAATP